VNPGPPVAVYISVTLTAKPVRFGKIDELAVGEPQFVTVAGMVAVEAPSFFFRMTQLDGGMLFF